MLEKIATYSQKELEMRGKVRAAMAYRAVMIVVAVGVRTTPTFVLGDQEVLFDGRDYAQLSPFHTSYTVAGDDQRFLLVKDLGGTEDEIVLVLGWHRELAAKFEGR